MEELDYEKDLPKQPPENLIPYLRSRGKLKSEALVYSAAYKTDPLTDEKIKCVKVVCSACGNT